MAEKDSRIDRDGAEARVWYDVEDIPVRKTSEFEAETWDAGPPRPFPIESVWIKGLPISKAEFDTLVEAARGGKRV